MSCRFRVRISVVFEVGGRRVVDEDVARLLYFIDKYGSILAASRALGIAYSRAWETIARVEKLLGTTLIESRRGGRGGGGTRLTPKGRELLEEYVRTYERVTGKRFEEALQREFQIPDLVYMGSHDPCVELIAGMLRELGVKGIELSWVGSGLGLAALSLGEADIVGVHLYDPETGTYNTPYISKYWLEGRAVLIHGYERELGFVTRTKLGLDEVINGLVKGELRMVNRQRGSGTRILLDHILKQELVRRGLSPDLIRRFRGYDFEVRTHTDVAKAIATGEADVGMCIRWAASQYGLHFIPIKWEKFDFVVLKDRLGKEEVRKFIEILQSGKFKDMIKNLPGYRPLPITGHVTSI